MKDIDKLKGALVLCYIHSAAAEAMEHANMKHIAWRVNKTCCEAPTDADMIARIKGDEDLPEAMKPWLLRIYETLEREDAEKAAKMVCSTLIGTDVFLHASALENYAL